MIPGPESDPYLIRIDRVTESGRKEQVAIFHANAVAVDASGSLQIVSGTQAHVFAKSDWHGFEVVRKHA